MGFFSKVFDFFRDLFSNVNVAKVAVQLATGRLIQQTSIKPAEVIAATWRVESMLDRLGADGTTLTTSDFLLEQLHLEKCRLTANERALVQALVNAVLDELLRRAAGTDFQLPDEVDPKDVLEVLGWVCEAASREQARSS